jgi:acyl carrier protein
MPSQDDRLIRCFASVFPTLTTDEIRKVSTDSTGIWDSLASVTLAAVIQEEFNVEIESVDLAKVHSFEAFQTYLSQLGPIDE